MRAHEAGFRHHDPQTADLRTNEGRTRRARATPTSRPVSMISRDSKLNPVFNARPRW